MQNFWYLDFFKKNFLRLLRFMPVLKIYSLIRKYEFLQTLKRDY